MIDLNKIKDSKSLSELLEFGIININKPSGPTSFNISDFVRKKLSNLGARKTSHFGTLDPKVTGVLPIALNRACKLTGFFIGEDKEYVGIMRFHEEVDINKLKDKINEKFLGKIKQTPPVRSRVKRVEREREVKSFDVIEQDGKDFLFHASVQGGTYIRKLIDDLGSELNVGAHMLELRRIRAGIFMEEGDFPSYTLYELDEALKELSNGNEEKLRSMIIPGEIISQVYETININGNRLREIFTGKPIYSDDIIDRKFLQKDQIVCVFFGLRFVEMAKVFDEKKRVLKPEFVLQEIK